MIELQDIVQKFGEQFKNQYPVYSDARKAMNAITSCRTSKLEGHMEVCHDCGAIRISYNSCRNRNCPKCGNLKKEQWILDRISEMLPVSCFHTVFTVPDSLNPLFLSNPPLMYNLLFQAASQTLLLLSGKKKYLGAQIGITMVLHTWGQNLSFHPHVHCVVPGGGLSTDGSRFIRSRKKFFLPVKILSRVFRGKFLSLLKSAFVAKKLQFFGDSKIFSTDQGFYGLVDSLYQKDWIVYCKKPFKNSDGVVEYLSRYTHKTAIYNNRLIAMDDNSVSFKWRDYKDGNKTKIMKLDAMEFIRRFLLHVLPSGFQKIRYYGLFSNRNRTTKLKKCFRLLKKKFTERVHLSTRDLILKVHGVDILVCPHCGGQWMGYRTLWPGEG